MITESYSVYSVSLDLLEGDGFGPLDYSSKSKIAHARDSGAEVPTELSSDALIDNSAPLILLPHLNYLLLLEDQFASNMPNWIEETRPDVSVSFTQGNSLGIVGYIGGELKLDTSKDSSWINLQGSSFSLAVGISIGTARSPKVEVSEVTVRAIEELEHARKKQYPLRKFVPERLELGISDFPEAFCFDGTEFFRDSWIQELNKIGWVGLEKTGTSCLCCIR